MPSVFETLFHIDITEKVREAFSEKVKSEPNSTQNSKKRKSFVRKVLSLKHPKDNPDLLLVDIRSTFNNRPSKNGVCLTAYEYDWLLSCLAFAPEKYHKLLSKSSARQLEIISRQYSSANPDTNLSSNDNRDIEQQVLPSKLRSFKAVDIVQTVNGDQVRKITLYKKEVNYLVGNYGTVVVILQELESEDESDDEMD